MKVKEKTYSYEELLGMEDKAFNANKFLKHDRERDPINLVFIGHVDHGKSTLSGRVLKETGQVDDTEMKKYEMEAKEKKMDGWYLAYIMD